jgi:hypothetical protein
MSSNFLNSPTNLNTTGQTKTTAFFNNYFDPSLEISQNVNDAILSFFEQQTGDKQSAALLVQAVIETAKAQQVDPMTVLMDFQNLPQGELNSTLTLYLNASRVNTSFLGVKVTPKSNFYVARTIIT